jgi:kynureninase
MNADAARALDAADRLAPLRARFALPPDTVYLDGNSLGALPKATVERLRTTVAHEWGEGLIRSWNRAGWIELAAAVAGRIGRLVGARAEHVSVGDSTSVNLFKVLSAAAQLVPGGGARHRIVSERDNFPTDLYLAESVAERHGLELVLADGEDGVLAALDERTAIAMLTHVDYRTGRRWRMREATDAIHAAGALAVWDLAHSAGAVPLALEDDGADFAVGCGYKYLNGGPGAPAFLWVHPRHLERIEREGLRQPLSGWLGHAAPFAFESAYRPAAGIGRFACGTWPVLSLAALDEGVRVFDAAEPLGGMAALRAKSVALVDAFVAAVETRCAGHGLALVTPRDAERRGSQASFACPGGVDAFAVMAALIERGTIGDFRAGGRPGEPDLLRFGFAPLYNAFDDAWRAAGTLADVLATEAWRAPRFAARSAVT